MGALSFPLRAWLLVFALAFGVYGISVFALTQGQAGPALAGLGSWHGLLAVALCLTSYLLRGQRWIAWMSLMGRPLGRLEGLRFYLAGYAFTPTPANIGEAMRGLLLKREPLTLSSSLALYGAERLADLLCLLLLALPLLGWLLPAGPYWAGAALLLGISLMLLVTRRWRPMLEQRLPWLAQAWDCLATRPANWFGLTLAAWLAQGLAIWLLFQQLLQAPISPLLATSMYATAMVGGALSMLPAGLGGTEAILVALLLGQGASLAIAILLTVMVRLLTLWFAVALGIACLLYSTLLRKDLRLGAAP